MLEEIWSSYMERGSGFRGIPFRPARPKETPSSLPSLLLHLCQARISMMSLGVKFARPMTACDKILG
jgi:hypothetical protein